MWKYQARQKQEEVLLWVARAPFRHPFRNSGPNRVHEHGEVRNFK